MRLLTFETLSLMFLFASVSGAASAAEAEAATAQTVLVEVPRSQAQLTLPECEISKPDYRGYSPPGASTEIVSTAAAMGTKVMEQLELESPPPVQTVLVQSQTEMTWPEWDMSVLDFAEDCWSAAVSAVLQLLEADTETTFPQIPFPKLDQLDCPAEVTVKEQPEPVLPPAQPVLVQSADSSTETAVPVCDIPFDHIMCPDTFSVNTY